jgi:hypothetical protein
MSYKSRKCSAFSLNDGQQLVNITYPLWITGSREQSRQVARPYESTGLLKASVELTTLYQDRTGQECLSDDGSGKILQWLKGEPSFRQVVEFKL